ncbi:MAG: type II toxin-antitoxin system RelE/ParE family toxin [Candidatus Pacebacteria bacterium]|jgi:mRNA interferase RelE/StbE|nr:type II toxin-antitoxin system RelE/ParE family toxin [Candidatus Paceibacterota bacterium]
MHKVLFTKKAEKELAGLPSQVKNRVSVAIDELVQLGIKASHTKKLQTPFPGYRKRVGDYRILYECNEDFLIIYKISKRAEAYR